MNPRSLFYIIPLLLSVNGCFASQPFQALIQAEALYYQDKQEEALQAYPKVIEQCNNDAGTMKRWCDKSYRQYAHLLTQNKKYTQALSVYETIVTHPRMTSSSVSIALYKQSILYLNVLDLPHKGYRQLWHIVMNYPQTSAATLSLSALTKLTAKTNPSAFYNQLGSVLTLLAHTNIADNILMVMAEISNKTFHQSQTALAHYSQIISFYPQSTFLDDALWYSAGITYQQNLFKRTAQYYHQLLTLRRLPVWLQKYPSSQWADSAQQNLGLLYRDKLNQPEHAIKAFTALIQNYPHSVLQDNALWEIANTWDALGDSKQACLTLTELKKQWPRSKFTVIYHNDLHNKLQCPQ